MSEIVRFAEAILHGDDEHRAWLLEAAHAWVNGGALPDVRGGSAKDAEIARLQSKLHKISKALAGD